MYYEIMSRSIPADFGYKRRTMRPQRDPINAMLSFGYALLFGNCSVTTIGAHLNPDAGVMHTGKGSLIYDLINPLKAKMVDNIVFHIAQESLTQSDYEVTDNRCILSEELLNNLMAAFYTAFTTEQLNEQVCNFYNAAKHGEDFKSLY
jgi:CRISPR-associated endonuclease Cas1